MKSKSFFSNKQVADARLSAEHTRRSVVEVLEEQSGLTAENFVRALSEQLHYRVYDMSQLQAMSPAFEVLPFSLALERECLVLWNEDDRLILVISDPFKVSLQSWAEQHIHANFDMALAHRSDILAYLSHHEESLHAMDDLAGVKEFVGGEEDGVEDLSIKSISEAASPVVKLVQSTVYDALKAEASDIHMETTASGLVIRYRIDGVLTTVATMAGLAMADQVISRIKVISSLDIAERRIPQDGRFKVSMRGHEVDLRVSIMPSSFGEDAVLRVLDKRTVTDQKKALRLDYLGFDDRSLAMMRRLSREPYGMVLVTGPTGSGKTTTLYAAITEINHGLDKIITIEDPVEYQLAGVLQIPVNEKKGLTFAKGLRSILRHDPDKIMVGEIRDSETAQIAVQSALTGHLVFTTVHANNVFDVIGRFIHMGVEPYSFVSSLNGILAQRLVRVNCTACSVEDHPSAELIEESGLTADQVKGMTFRVGRGCGKCRGTGFKGRKAIAEILSLNEEIRELIIARAPLREIKEAARRNGTYFLRESALALVANGETTLQEINRVTLVS